MNSPNPDPAINPRAIQRRTLSTLMTGQALGTAAQASMLAALGLLAAEVLGSDRLAGLPAAAATLGTAVVATPLATRASRSGRRPAMWTGYGLGAVGALVAVGAGQAGLFLLLLAGMAIFGGGQAAGLQTRFAAADLADPETRARDISRVVWIGTIGGFLGPILTPVEDRLGRSLGLGNWVGPMVAASAFYLLAAGWAAYRLRPDPLVVRARWLGLPPVVQGQRQRGRAWRVVRTNPMAMLAITALAISQATMVAVMTMTPLHMRDHGHAELSAVVIAVHVVGMFGLAPLVGRYTDRVGALRAIRNGGLILATGVAASVIAGYQPSLMFVGLFLLGLGWNFGLIASSALLTATVGDESRVAAQGLSDTVLSGLGAAAALLSGLIKQGWGFHWLANLAAALALAMVIMATVATRSAQGLRTRV